MDQQFRLAQLEEELQKKCLEINELQSENEKLREELLSVKTRNRRLCGILAKGESNDKLNSYRRFCLHYE